MKLKFILLFMMFALLLVTSCSKDDNQDASNNFIEADGVKEPILKMVAGDYSIIEHQPTRGTGDFYGFELVSSSKRSLEVFLPHYETGTKISLSSYTGYTISGYDNFWINSKSDVSEDSYLQISKRNNIYTVDIVVSFKKNGKYHNLKAHYVGDMVVED